MASTVQAQRVTGHRATRGGTAKAAPGSSRSRVIVEVAALLLIASLLVAIPLLSRHAVSGPPADTAKVLVHEGDTLWSVALANPVPGLGTAEAVEYIASVNGVQSARLSVGTSILVPAGSRGTEVASK